MKLSMGFADPLNGRLHSSAIGDIEADGVHFAVRLQAVGGLVASGYVAAAR